MKKLLLTALALLISIPLWSEEQGNRNNIDSIVSEIETMSSSVIKKNKKLNDRIIELSDAIKKRGYLESQLLKAQDYLIEAARKKQKNEAPTSMGFLGIHAYLLSSWKLQSKTEEEAFENHIFPITRDSQYSWNLRSHYLRRAEGLIRDRRDRKTESMQKYRKKVLLLAKKIESDKKEVPEMKAEALNIIASYELNDSERQRLLLKHCRSQNEFLHKVAIRRASFPANLNDEIVEELLSHYEEKESFSEPLKQEIRHAISRMGRFAKTPKNLAYKEKVINRLEQLKNRKRTKKEREEIEDLIDDMTRDPKTLPKREKRNKK